MSIGYPDYGGVNLIKSPVIAVGVENISVAPGVSFVSSPILLTGTSYSLTVFPWQSAGSTKPFITVALDVQDSSGLGSDFVTFDLPIGINEFDAGYLIHGPLLSNYVIMTITTQDTVASNVRLGLDSTNIERPFHTVTTRQLKTFSGGVSLPPSLSPSKGILGTWYQAAVPAGSSVPFLVPPAPGPVSIGVRADSGTSDVAITAAPYISENAYGGLTHGNLLTGRTDANGNFMATINFPRSAMAFNIQNKGAAAQGISTTLVFDVTSG